MTPEQKQRIEQIRERQEKRRHEVTRQGSYTMNTITLGDIDFLLSLVESQEAEINAAWLAIERGWEIEPREYFEREAPRNGFKSPLAQAVHHMWKRKVKDDEDESAATSMRSRCVEKVRALPDHATDCNLHLSRVHVCSCSFRAEAIKALESVSIQEQENRDVEKGF